MKYKIIFRRSFWDSRSADYSKMRNVGEEYETDDDDYVKWAIESGLARLKEIHSFDIPKGESGTFVCFTGFAKVGGIETATYSLVRKFPKMINILITNGDEEFLMKIGKYANVIIDERKSGKYKAKSVILAHWNSYLWLDNFEGVEKTPVYQQVLADMNYYKEKGEHELYRPYINDKRINELLAVSENAQKGLKDAFGKESTLLRNVKKPKEEKALLFGFFSRSTAEKNPQGLMNFIQKVEESGKKAIYFLASDFEKNQPILYEKIKTNKNIVYVGCDEDAMRWMPKMDYLIQLSKGEASCEVVREALDNGIPVIVSKIPAFDYIEDGKHGYHVDNIPTTSQINKIYKEVPKIDKKVWNDETDVETWTKVLNGEL